MRQIDLETWPRTTHFKFFTTWDFPHFNLCANVDLTAFHPAVKQRGVSFNIATIYVIARAANAIPEFRYRIRGDSVVEHEIVHPASTILLENDLFTFCQFEYTEDFAIFAEDAAGRIEQIKANPSLEDEPGRDDVLYMTALPWVSFTSVMHPLILPADSIPRLAWGKFFKEGDSVKLPLSVQGHHALMDGLHAGRFYAEVQNLLDQPDFISGIS